MKIETSGNIYLGRDILDHQLIDKNGVFCGKVDDMEIELKGEPRATAILVGPKAWLDRLPNIFQTMFKGIFKQTKVVRIPLEDIAKITNVVMLNKSAQELGLIKTGTKIKHVMERIPGHD